MSQEISKEVSVAIAYALHELLGKNMHDKESYLLTIKHQPTAWNNKIQTMRELPKRP